MSCHPSLLLLYCLITLKSSVPALSGAQGHSTESVCRGQGQSGHRVGLQVGLSKGPLEDSQGQRQEEGEGWGWHYRGNSIAERGNSRCKHVDRREPCVQDQREASVAEGWVREDSPGCGPADSAHAPTSGRVDTQREVRNWRPKSRRRCPSLGTAGGL